MNEPKATYDASPCHYETVPIGALSAKSHELTMAYRTIEELQQQVAELKREVQQVRALLDKAQVGGKDEAAHGRSQTRQA